MRSSLSTLAECVSRLAEEKPELPLFRYLANGEAESPAFTPHMLKRDAIILASLLLQRAAPGDRVLLLAAPGIDFLRGFFAIQFAGMVATASTPTAERRSDRNLERLRGIVASCQPTVALTTQEFSATAEQLNLPALRIDGDYPEVDAAAFRTPTRSIDDPAFLQYTSGSTREARGVILTHRNLSSNSQFIAERFGHSADSVGVIWLPPYHDMGLIGGILQPMFVGFPVILMSPHHVLQRPMRWLNAISKYRATTSGGPNFIYEHCVDLIDDSALETLDLSSWSVAFCGAETVRPATWRRFSAKFSRVGFRSDAFFPCYGLAESTLMVTGGHTTSETDCVVTMSTDPKPTTKPIEIISCGQPADDSRLSIVDPVTREPLPAGQVGEIVTTGPSVSPGYWNEQELNKSLFEQGETIGDHRVFTGDLGFIKNEQLFVTGRAKDLIILRGRNLYSHDLELTVEAAHAQCMPNGACAFSVDNGNQESLVILIELRPGIRKLTQTDRNALLNSVRRSLSAEFQVAAHEICLVRAGSIPRTTSGKKRRSQCRTLYEAKHFHAPELAIAQQTDPAPARGIQKANQQSLRRQRTLALIMVVTPVLGVVAAIALSWGRGIQLVDLGWMLGMYLVTVLGIEVGFHRLFSHRSFQTTAAIRWILGVCGSMAAQGPLLFWVATHRRHHAFSDQPDDPHSPATSSRSWRDRARWLWHAHIGWLFSNQLTDPMAYAPDVFRDPLAYRISREYPFWVIAGLLLPAVGDWAMTGEAIGCLRGVLWGGLVRVFLVHHATWSVNSICHAFGQRAFETRDESRNNALLALSSLGGSWHNNHHAFPTSAFTGFRMWEIDPSGWLIRCLRTTGLAWDVNHPSPEEQARKRNFAMHAMNSQERKTHGTRESNDV